MRRATCFLAVALTIAFTSALLAGGPQAVFPESEWYFGLVKQGERVVHSYVVRNTGDGMLRFEDVSLSLAGMQCRFPRELGPNEQAMVTVAMSTWNLTGNVEGEAIVRTNDPARPETRLLLAGRVD
jgi:uncharacterized protein DUF1573